MFNVANGALISTIDSSDPSPVKIPLPIITENSTNNITDWIADNYSSNSTVYIDMDNTLANFNKGLAALFGLTNARDIGQPVNVKSSTVAAAMPGFFAGLEKLPQADNLVMKFLNYTLLTTDTGYLNGNGEKADWAQANLSNFFYPPLGIEYALNFDKAPYASPTTILIDDSPTYVQQFKDAGGLAFRYIWSEIVAGSLPPGLNLVDNTIVGSPVSQNETITSTFTVRVHDNEGYIDRELSIRLLADPDYSVWNVPSPYDIGRFIERTQLDIDLPIDSVNSPTIKLIAGELPAGLRLEGYKIKGAAFEVKRLKTFKFVLRATLNNVIADRTFEITIEGEDVPEWITPEGPLNIGSTYTQSFWFDQTNTNFGIFTAIGTNSYTQQTVTYNEGIPSNTVGSDGDYLYDTVNNVFYFKYDGLWKLFNQTSLRGVYGNNTRLEVSETRPNPLDVDFWFNINPANNGLDLRISRFDSSLFRWKPQLYKLSKTAPIDPEDKDVWIQYFDNDTKLLFKYYDRDELQWDDLPYTASPVPPERASNAFFVLDNSKVEFPLEVIDADLSAGETLKYYIADGDGELPPGLTLSSDGIISGIVDPILALDSDNYDPYGDSTRQQQGVTDTDGFDSDPYDVQFYGYGLPSRNPRKLNREYEFFITVADDVSDSKRRFSIYVVSDDFLRADNTIMRSATGLFTADVTYLRKPIWITRGNLGSIRADNYQTIFIDVYDPNYLLGNVNYLIREYNDDGTRSVIPEGLDFDTKTGELAGIIPYQPAVEVDYKFTIEATRSEADEEVYEVNTNIYEDTLAGMMNLKVNKISRSLEDGIDDIEALKDTQVTIENNDYLIVDINEDNPQYDVLQFGYPLLPSPFLKPLTLSRNIVIGDSVALAYRNNLTETDISQWVGRNINYGSTYNYVKEIDFVNNYRFVGESNQSMSVNFDAAGITIIPGEPIQTSIKRALAAITNIQQDLIIVDVTDLTSIAVNIPQTALSNNRNLLESVFDTEDSSPVYSVVDDDTVKITFNNSWSLNVAKDTQFALGAIRNKRVSKRVLQTQSEFTSTSKTFTLKVLGNIDSTIQWITPSELPNLGANRISYLKVVAQTTLEGANLRYDLLSGKLPVGLELKRNGEIVGTVKQFGTATDPGLTTLDNRAITFDGKTTTFDRKFSFKVLARDRFGYSALSRTFSITILDLDTKLYSNVYMQPFLVDTQRNVYNDFINDYTIFDASLIYRPYDSNFGVQKDLRTLAYAGIEQKNIENFAAAVRLNHGKKKFAFGELKTAVAKQPGTNDIVYEVVYVDVIDPGKPKTGDTQLRAKIRTGTELKINQVKKEARDDESAKVQGQGFFSISTRSGVVVKVPDTNGLTLVTRTGNLILPTNGGIAIIGRNGTVSVPTQSLTNDASGDPFRFRPKGDVITADQTSVIASQSKDQYRYINNIGTMRKRIAEIGANEREFLPLWMRTAQDGSLSELDYVTALPLCYTVPGGAKTIKENIENAGFDFKQINYQIDRYIVDKTADNNQETYILFPRHTFNNAL